MSCLARMKAPCLLSCGQLCHNTLLSRASMCMSCKNKKSLMRQMQRPTQVHLESIKFNVITPQAQQTWATGTARSQVPSFMLGALRLLVRWEGKAGCEAPVLHFEARLLPQRTFAFGTNETTAQDIDIPYRSGENSFADYPTRKTRWLNIFSLWTERSAH